jgi:hypothetical protein
MIRKFLSRSKLVSKTMLSIAVIATMCSMTVGQAHGAAVGLVQSTAASMPTIGLNGLLTDQNYDVSDLKEACGQMFAGGHFVTAYSADGKTSYPRNGIFSFNEATKAISTSFNPVIAGSNNTVWSLLPTSDCKSVYIGGAFTSVDGLKNTGYLVKYNLATNTVDPTFSGRVNGIVYSLTMWNNALIVGGAFTTAGGTAETALAQLNATTGTNTGYFTRIGIAGSQPSTTAGPTRVKTVAVSPTATQDHYTGVAMQHIVMAGNWATVSGVSRGQVAMLSLGTIPTLSAWDATILHGQADHRFGNYLRGVSFMPDGKTFYLAASGSAYPLTGLNDSVSAWSMVVTGALVNPLWVNKTGGDTLWAVAATPNAIYITGHERWANNPKGTDSAGAGAVSRPGIGAIDPKTGLALSWNPQKSRQVGGYALLITAKGLWVGSDGALLGCAAPAGVNHDDCTNQTLQPHAGIGFLPY